MVLKRPRLPWWTLPVAGAITMTLLGALGIWQLLQTTRLAVALKQTNVEAAIRYELGPLLDQPDPIALQTAVSGLIRDELLQLSYVELVDAQGKTLVFDGRPERLHGSDIPGPVVGVLRDAAYRWSENIRVVPLAPHQGASLQVRYLMLRSLPGDVHQAALIRLGWSGVLSLFLAIGIGTASAMAWQRTVPVSQVWLRRLDADTTAGDSAAEASPERLAALLFNQNAASLLDEIDRAIIVVDHDAIVRLLNASATRLTGWKSEEAQGLPVYSVFHPLDARLSPQLTPAEICLRDQRACPAGDLHLRARDGSTLPIEVSAMPLRLPSGRVNGAAMMFHEISEREARGEQWRRQARLSQAVIDQLIEGLITTDPAGVIRSVNARALRMFGYGREELEGVSISKLMPVPFLNSPSVRLDDYISAERGANLPKVVGWRRDATTFPLELIVQTMRLDQSEGLVLILRDITERLRSENLAQRLGRLLDAASEEVYILDAASLYFVEVNRGARRNLGYHPSEMTRMTPLSISLELESETFLQYLARLRGGEVEHLTYRCRHRRADGSSYPVEVRLNYSRDEEPPVFMAIAVDISERERDEQRLRYLAHHDSLTGLPNRSTLLDRLSQALLVARRSNRQVGVLFMDIDRFKSVNDRYGHELGDAVLQQVATRLQNVLRATDTVARLGGDEFVVLASGLRVEQDVVDLAQKIHRAFNTALDIPQRQLQITLSIGIAVSAGDGRNVGDVSDQLLHHADLAMYQAKQAGPGRTHLHASDVSSERRRQLDLERGLQAALALNQLRLELLPAFSAGGGVLQAALAGFYWQSPLHGRVEAAEASAIALRAGLQAELELWRLSGAVSLLGAGAGAGVIADLTMIVPISGWQLRAPDFAVQVGELVQRHALVPNRLILVTDVDGLQQTHAAAHQTLRRLNASGVRVGLQDRAEHIETVLERGDLPPLDLIVLNVAELQNGFESDDAGRTVVHVLQLARQAHLPVLATGVDNLAVADDLRARDCALVAGAAIQMSMAAEVFAGWCRQREPQRF